MKYNCIYISLHITPYILFYLALQGTPDEFVKGDSAKAINMYVELLSLTPSLLIIALKPLDKKFILLSVLSALFKLEIKLYFVG